MLQYGASGAIGVAGVRNGEFGFGAGIGAFRIANSYGLGIGGGAIHGEVCEVSTRTASAGGSAWADVQLRIAAAMMAQVIRTPFHTSSHVDTGGFVQQYAIKRHARDR